MREQICSLQGEIRIQFLECVPCLSSWLTGNIIRSSSMSLSSMHVSSPPMPSVFLGHLLENNEFEPLDDNFAVSRFLMESALNDLDGQPLDGPSQEGDEMIAQMLAQETMYVLTRKDAPSSLNWYTDSIERMVAVAALLHPEIAFDEEASKHSCGRFKSALEARVVLFTAMALTSQNNAVLDNMRYALEQYRTFIESGHFQPKVYGANGQAVYSNLARFNFVLDQTKGDLTRFHRLMTMRMQMRDLKRVAARYDIALGGKELVDEEVYGSMIFGPKVGNGFLQNLLGNHKPITIDLWFMRTWGRYTGTIIRDQLDEGARDRLVAGLRNSLQSKNMSKLMQEFGVMKRPADIREMDDPELLAYARHLKLFWEKLRRHYTSGKLNDRMDSRSPKLAAKHHQDNEAASNLKARLVWPGACEAIMRQLGSPVDSPKNAKTRAWIRSVCHRALGILKSHGFNMTAANLQATLWYPEKELYGKLTGRPVSRFTMSYDDAIIEVARKEGIGDDAIEAALRSSGAHRTGRHVVSNGDEQRLSEADVGLHQRVA